MKKQSTLKIEKAQDNPYYMTYEVIDDSTGKRCTRTERVHRAEDPTDAIKYICAKAEDRGYIVKSDPRYTSGW